MNRSGHQSRGRHLAAALAASLTLCVAAGAHAQSAEAEDVATPIPEAWQSLTAALAPSIQVTHHELVAHDDRLTATSVRFVASDQGSSPGALTVGRLELVGPTDASAPDVIADRLILHDVLYRPGGSGVGRIERLTVEQASGLAGFLQALVTLPDPDAEADDVDDGADAAQEVDPADAQGSFEAVLSALLTLEMQALTVEGVTTVERRGHSRRQQTLSLDRLTLGTVDEGSIEALVLEGLAITDRSQVNIDRVDLRAINIGHWLTMAASTEVEMVPLALILDPGIEAVSVVGVEMFGQDGSSLLTMSGGHFETQGDDRDTAASSIAVDRLAFPVSTLDDAEAETALRELGYLDVQGSFGMTVQLDRAAETLTLGPIRLALVDMATVDVTLTLGRFDLETLVGQLQTMARTGIPQLPPTTLDSASIVLTDASLTDRLLQRTARIRGVTTDAIVGETVGQATSVADEWRLEEPHRATLLDAIRDFLTAPGVFAVEAEPERPVTLLEAGLGAVAGPGTLFDRLNVTITTQ